MDFETVEMEDCKLGGCLTKIIVVHHNDPDGWASAAIVGNAANHQVAPAAIKYVEMNYGYKPEEFNEILKAADGIEVVIVDFSFSDEEMIKLAAATEELYIVDHHVTAIERIKKLDIPNLYCSFDDWETNAACAIAAKELGLESNVIDYIDILDRFDVENPRYQVAREVVTYLKLQEGFDDPSSELWSEIINSQLAYDLTTAKEVGKLLVQKEDQIFKNSIRDRRPVTLDGLKLLSINVPNGGSVMLKSVSEKELSEYDGIVFYSRAKDGGWLLSFRGPSKASPIDLTPLALARGGGGHPHACGCKVDVLPF